jgi:FMN-dependent NADH-azoreductase
MYINASPMGKLSYSTAVADAFIEAYKKTHPKDEIKVLDLFTAKLPEFDFIAASGKYKIMHGKPHSAEEKTAWEKIVVVINEFKIADKYVFAVPMWNFSIPYRLKQYIDIIVQPGLTFSTDEKGNYIGLVKNKPVFIAYARGGKYPTGSQLKAFDFQKKYWELILAFMGLSNIRSVTVEPTLLEGPEIAQKQKEEAVEKAKKIAPTF